MWKYLLITVLAFKSSAFDFNADLKKFLEATEKVKTRDEVKNLTHNFYESLKKVEGTKNDNDEAQVLRFSLDLTLTVQTFTYEECLSARMAHFTNFGIRSNDLLNPSELPRMAKLSYGILNKMCNLKN